MSDREAVKRLSDAKNFVSLGYTHSALMAIDDAIKILQAAQAQAKPIAAVRGYYNGMCVVDTVGDANVLPAGMALYSQPQAQAGDGEAPVAWLKPAHELVENSAPDVVTAELRGATIARGGIAASCMENYSVPLYKKQPAVNQQLPEGYVLVPKSALDGALYLAGLAVTSTNLGSQYRSDFKACCEALLSAGRGGGE